MTARNERRACGTFVGACRSCCAAAGTDCAARCGDGTVTTSTGETCDPPGVACADGGTCSADCRCPTPPVTTTTRPTVSTTTTTRPSGSTTSTTLPTLGSARFVVDDGSHWFASSAPGFEILDSVTGAFTLTATPSGGADATLTLQSDAVIGVHFLGDTILCLRLLASGTSGTLHCAPSTTGVDVDWTIDSNGPYPSLRSDVTPRLGGPSAPGDAFLIGAARVITCPGPGCLAPLTSIAGCFDPRVVDFAVPATFALPLTTGTAVGRILNPRAGSAGNAIPTTVEGAPFSCASWNGANEGALGFPLIAVDLPGIGDWTSAAILHVTRFQAP